MRDLIQFWSYIKIGSLRVLYIQQTSHCFNSRIQMPNEFKFQITNYILKLLYMLLKLLLTNNQITTYLLSNYD